MRRTDKYTSTGSLGALRKEGLFSGTLDLGLHVAQRLGGTHFLPLGSLPLMSCVKCAVLTTHYKEFILQAAHNDNLPLDCPKSDYLDLR